MDKIILWGSGNCGRYMHEMLSAKGFQIIAFGDADGSKIGQNLCDKPIISREKIQKEYEDVDIVISVQRENNEIIRKELKSAGLMNNIFTLNEILVAENAGNRRNECAEFHNNHMDEYFTNAERKTSLEIFWGENSAFRKKFQKLQTDKIIELACGRGRHVRQYVDEADEIVLVDILERNIQYCKERFRDYNKINYYVNSGYDLKELRDNYYTAIFSYDSMVHFESIDVYHYLIETQRVLVTGGMALYHHSNNHNDYRVSFMTGENGRNYMSMDLFAHFADRAGLEIVEQEIYKWGNVEDGITLLRKK